MAWLTDENGYALHHCDDHRSGIFVKRKQSAQVAFYEGIKQAAAEQFKATEEGLRKLKGLGQSEIDKLVADVHGRHENLLKRIDRHIDEEAVRAKEDLSRGSAEI